MQTRHKLTWFAASTKFQFHHRRPAEALDFLRSRRVHRQRHVDASHRERATALALSLMTICRQ